MQKQAWIWSTPHLSQPARLARWGHFGAPVLIFPSAGGDFEEIERFRLIAALAQLIDGGRIKVYSLDALAVRARLAATRSPQECADLEERYDSHLSGEVLQRIRTDCRDERIEPILAGAALGAATAVSTLCRHPELFRAAVGISGSYGGRLYVGSGSGEAARCYGASSGESFQASSNMAALEGPQLESLRRRTILLGSGAGDYETPAESQRLADNCRSKAIPCRLNLWDATRDHTWATWLDMLPPLLAELL